MEILNKTRKTLIGMVHTLALPGTPQYKGSINKIIDKACEEAEVYEKFGLSSIILENMHDVPYMNRKVGPEITTAMTAISVSVRRVFSGNIGIQILAGANKEAIAVANAAGLQFIRAEGFVYSHVADEGLMNACAGELLRYRKNIGAESVKILTDIKKKHSSHSITNDVSLAETAKAAEFFLTDGLIVTGASTGLPADIEEVKTLYNCTELPVLIGSGINDENIGSYYEYADGFIVGSFFKDNHYWSNDLNKDNIEKILTAMSKHN